MTPAKMIINAAKFTTIEPSNELLILLYISYKFQPKLQQDLKRPE